MRSSDWPQPRRCLQPRRRLRASERASRARPRDGRVAIVSAGGCFAGQVAPPSPYTPTPPPPGLMERAGAEHCCDGAAVEVEQPGKTLEDHVHMLASSSFLCPFQMKSFYVRAALCWDRSFHLHCCRATGGRDRLLWHHSPPIPVSGFSKVQKSHCNSVRTKFVQQTNKITYRWVSRWIDIAYMLCRQSDLVARTDFVSATG